MSNPEHLLSDEFAAFVEKIQELHGELKYLNAEFKKQYDEYNANRQKLLDKAAQEEKKWLALDVSNKGLSQL